MIKKTPCTLTLCLLVLFYWSTGTFAQNNAQTNAQTNVQNNQTAWFGITPPPAFKAHSLPVIIGDKPPAPLIVPADEEAWPEFNSETLYADVERIVEFAKQSRRNKEVGDGQMWGRIAGFPSAANTIQWAVQQFKQAGIENTALQTFKQTEDARLWLPLRWKMNLIGDAAFGKDTRDLELQSAMPLPPSELPADGLRAPLVYVGTGSAAEIAHIDVRNKIAVQRITPQAHMVFVRSPTVPRARTLFERGAVAVINLVDLPGNELARDFSNCGGPCFNVGGRDSHFLELLMNEATAKGVADKLQIELQLQSQYFSGMQAQNGIAVVPGASEETIVVNAHADAWFDGAGDNGDGLAVLIALAKHFAKAENKPQKTLVFVASAGHHTSGLHGPHNFVAMNPDIIRNTVLTINIEHVAQRNIVPSRIVTEDGYRQFITDAGEAPITAGITNNAPFLENLFVEGVQRYGTNFVSGQSDMASGEGGGYRNLGFPIVTTMQAPPLYHTSGEVTEMISKPGLARMAHFLAFFIKQVGNAPRDQIDPGA